jgi:hypothetical protein
MVIPRMSEQAFVRTNLLPDTASGNPCDHTVHNKTVIDVLMIIHGD